VAHELSGLPQPLLHLGPGRSVADDQDPDVRPRPFNDLQRPGEIPHVLLGRQPTHMADHDLLGPDIQLTPDSLPPGPIRPEVRAVYPPWPKHQALESPGLQLANRGP